MLVLSRKINESLIIDDQIIVTILGVEGERVRLGISAPAEVDIVRQEVCARRARRTRRAAPAGTAGASALAPAPASPSQPEPYAGPLPAD